MNEAESPAVLSRREFVATAGLALAGAVVDSRVEGAEPLIDIHQHLGYSGRPDDVLLAHQRQETQQSWLSAAGVDTKVEPN